MNLRPQSAPIWKVFIAQTTHIKLFCVFIITEKTSMLALEIPLLLQHGDRRRWQTWEIYTAAICAVKRNWDKKNFFQKAAI